MANSIITSLNEDVFIQIFRFLDAKTTASLPFVCQYFNNITSSPACKDLWEIAGKNLGISWHFPGKTWKTTVCMTMDRNLNRKYSLSYRSNQARLANDGRLLTYDFASGLFASKFAPKKNVYKPGLILNKKGQVIWENRKGARVLFVIDLKKYSIEECILNRNTLAIHFVDEMGRSIVQAWDLYTGKQLLDFPLKFRAHHLTMNGEEIVLALRPNTFNQPPDECAVFSCSTETAWLDFHSKFQEKQGDRVHKISVCVAIFFALLASFAAYYRFR